MRSPDRTEVSVIRSTWLALALIVLAGCPQGDPPELGSTTAAIELNCRDDIDQDGDGMYDCADPECGVDPYCATCGNGMIDPPEGCDDGNVTANDGCSSACRPEAGYTCRFPGTPCVMTLCEVATVGTAEFLRGNYVEIGLNRNGAFGTHTNQAPAGWHSRSDQEVGEIGFVADPQGTNWTAFHGDFFTPGDPEEGWALDVNGVITNNNRSSLEFDMPGSLAPAECITDLSAGRDGARVTWRSSAPVGGAVNVQQDYTILDGGVFILIDVALTNVTVSDLTDVFYMRNVDPDNDITLHGDYSTDNTIVSQPTATDDLAMVRADQDIEGFQSSISIVARDQRARVTWGGFNNRSPRDVWFGTGGLSQSGNVFDDIGISIAFKVDIPAGQTVSFRFAYNLETSVDDVLTTVEADADADGVPNADDTDPADPNVCRDADTDTCDDCAGGFDNPFGDGADFDGDGLCDAGDPDRDNDGVANADDLAPQNPSICRDTDSDSCDDCLNTGPDGSGGDPATDGPDTDGDGLCDPGDADGDNDGVPDLSDANPTNPGVCRDLDGDGCDDCVNSGPDASGGDPANDGPDQDSDGTCDRADLDSDNDGILDTAETILPIDPGADHDGDGVPNYQDADDRGDGMANDCTNDGKGTCTVLPTIFDTDGDGVPNHLDLDSDGDGIFDVDESGSGLDNDHDGVADGPVGINGVPNSVEVLPDSGLVPHPVDTDGDGTPDFRDLDADGDGIGDHDESGDGNPATPPVDTDGDGMPDYRDLDSDGDTIGDDDEAGDADPNTAPVDTDVDGTPDFQDPDADGDGIPDNEEGGDGTPDTAPVDTDGDGTPDYRDPDADNDGVPDTDDGCPLIPDPGQDDLDNDGTGDPCDADRFGLAGAAGCGCATGGRLDLGALLVIGAALSTLRRRRRRAR